MNLEYGYHLAYRYTKEKLRDPAEAWINGDKEPALEAQRLHDSKIHARMRKWENITTAGMRHALVFQLRTKGYSLSEIADTVGISRRSVCRILAKMKQSDA